MSDAPLDLGTLTELFGSDEQTQKAILSAYSSSLPEYQLEFERAIAECSAAKVQAVAHKMKSSSRTVGALPLADLCDLLELAGKHGDWPRIEVLAKEFIPSICAVRNFIASDL